MTVGNHFTNVTSHKKKGAPFWNFSFTTIETPCNDIMEPCYTFQINLSVNKNIDNFEYCPPSQEKGAHF